MRRKDPRFIGEGQTFGVDPISNRQGFEGLDWGMALCSCDGQITYQVNSTFAKLHGIAIARARALPMLAWVCAEYRAQWLHQLQQGCEVGEAHFESRHRRADDTTFPVWVQVFPVADPGGNLAYVLIVVREIPECQPTRGALPESNGAVPVRWERHPQPIHGNSGEATPESEAPVDPLRDDRPAHIIACCDRQLRYIYVSPALEAVLGIATKQAIGKTPTELEMPAEFVRQWETAVRQVFATGQPQWREVLVPLGTQVRRYEAHFLPEWSSDRTVEYVLSVMGEVGDRRGVAEIAERSPHSAPTQQTEAVVKESEQYFRQLADTAPVMMWMADTQGRYCFFNQSWLNFTGRQLDPELGEDLHGHIHPEDRERFAQTFTLAFQVRSQFQLEYRLRRADGEYRWILETGVPRFSHNGEFAGYIGSGMDIGDLKQALDALRETQQRFQYLIASNPATIYTCEPTGCYSCTFISDNVRETLGYTPQAFLTDPQFWLDRLHPEDADRALANMSQLLNTGRSTQEYRFRHANGSYVWVRDDLKLVTDEAGNPLECIGSLLDISDRKRGEAEVFKALEKERELVELRSRLVSMTSHEFRTPLTTILSSAQLIQRYEWNRDEQLEIVGQIISAVKHMNELLEDVLSFGKVETGQLQFKPTLLNLREFCRRFVSEIQSATGRGKTIQLTIDSAATGRLVSARMDEKLLRQIIGNLLSNAMKYSPEGEEVEVSLTEQDGCAIFQIKDRGIGIPSEDQPHVFESFHRGRNVGTISGTGLGLAIVKKSLELHQGTLSLTSTMGVGTTFIVKIPLNKEGHRDKYD
ncbi:PAS domain-containing protein [Phormidium sp. CCY1219]|uniref:PAS domain-containing protein n=1 Tax=Phormidium sp. CCY1219 TaxID=2886104 RepID=UPI002D1EBBC8|nr:PAS domain-containing protein [Phormidium sp. CCY1219]MEB3826322.1 PAS domain-containing protein [Phormidium sp. CCY1219]